jgi:hypothetical protein
VCIKLNDGTDRIKLTEEVIKEFTAVLIRVEPIIDVGLETGVNVSVV